VSAGITTMRALLYSTLSGATAFSSYEWHAGPPPTTRVPNDLAVGYVWGVGTEQDAANKLLEKVTCRVRLYLTYEQRIDPATPSDPSALEQASSDVQTALAPISVNTGGDPWYVEVTSVQLDHDAATVDAVISGPRWNDAAVS
jgi:hypothetical protein